MKFQVNRDVLNEAVSFAARMLPQRITNQILGGILIDADQDVLRFSVFDYEVSAQVEISAKVSEPGSVLVSGRLLSEITSKLPAAPVEFETDGSKVIVTCGSSKFSLLTMAVEGYPNLPEIPEQTGVVAADAFTTSVQQVVVAASRDDVTPMLTGVLIEATQKSISLIASDRYRVALKEIPWKSNLGATTISAVIPSRTLAEIAKTFANQGEISISITSQDDREMIAFQANNRSVTSILIRGNFPAVKTLFPEKLDNFAVVSTSELIESTRRVSLVLERESPLRFTFEPDSVSLVATGNETAQASESIAADLTGKEIVVSLKPPFLLDGLAGIQGEYVRIGFTNNENPGKPGPILISSQSAKDKSDLDTYRYLLQPNLLPPR